MEDGFMEIEEAFCAYRTELSNYEKKSRATDGLLGFGRSLKDDACHERLDERISQAVQTISMQNPEPEEAERAVRSLLLREHESWPLAAQWMLRAVERHAIPLIGFLTRDMAQDIFKEYSKRYRPWDRLPAQKEIVQELQKKAYQ